MEIHKRQIRHYINSDNRDLFGDWILSLKDTQGQIAILSRIDRVEDGNFGDHSFVGHGVWELRIHTGPGYRVYYGEEDRVVVVLICGGSKHSQKKDVRQAQKIWENFRRSK